MIKKKILKKEEKSNKLSIEFGSILAIVSIIGFLDITSTSLFNYTFQSYIDFLWLTILGVGFILISQPNKIRDKKDTLATDITSMVIGGLAVIAGILSLPFLNVIHPLFLSIKGVIAIIAIIFIFIETWIIKK